MSGDRRTVLSLFGVRPYRIGGTEIFARELSERLAARGWRSVLGFSEAPSPVVRDFLGAPNVAFDQFRQDAYGARPGDVARLVRTYRPSILHLHFVGFVSLSPWVAKMLGTRRIYFTDQLSPPEGFVAEAAAVWKRLAVRAINAPLDAVISVSEYGRGAFAGRNLFPENRLRMIYNSVDVARAELGAARREPFRERYGIPADAPVFAQVGQLIPEKGVADLLRAAALVFERAPEARLVLAGAGPGRAEFEALAAKLGIAERVTFTGVLADPIAEGVYGAADVICQMSRWQEVFGYVIAEAMASGRPVVGTRVGGIPELIEPGETGFLVKRGETGEMADRILELLSNAALRARMGEAGQRAAAEKFNHKKNVARLMEIYFAERRGGLVLDSVEF